MPLDPTRTPSDEQLACRAQAGSVESFEELVRRYQTPVLHFLRHRGARAEAEDLLQETFVRAYVNLHRYRRRWRFATWLFTIARRLSINHHRQVRPLADGESLARAKSAVPDPAQAVAEAEHREMLWTAASAALSEEMYTALWLFYVEEMPVREIAAVVGRSWVAVKTMLFRARRKLVPLLRRLEPDYPAPPPQPLSPPARSAPERGGEVCHVETIAEA